MLLSVDCRLLFGGRLNPESVEDVLELGLCLDVDSARLAAVGRGDDAHALELVHDFAGAVVADLEASLDVRRAAYLALDDHLGDFPDFGVEFARFAFVGLRERSVGLDCHVGQLVGAGVAAL